MHRDDDLLVPADSIGTKCDVGGCEREGIFWVGSWRICGEHFNAYLRDEFDLEIYFQFKQRKIEEEMGEEETDVEEDWLPYLED